MRAWNVYVEGVKTGTVFFTESRDEEYVKQSLRNDYGIPIGFVVQPSDETYFDGSIDEE